MIALETTIAFVLIPALIAFIVIVASGLGKGERFN